MPETDARERDRAGTPYAVLLRAGARPMALIQVAWGRGYLGVHQFDEQARRIREFDFRVLDDPAQLRWAAFRHWLLDSPSDAEFSGDAWRFEVTINPQGWADEEFHADNSGIYATRWQLPADLRAIRRPPFGAWQSCPGTGADHADTDHADTDHADTDPADARPPDAGTNHAGTSPPELEPAEDDPRWEPPETLQPRNLEALFTTGATLRTRPDGYGEGEIAVVREPHDAGILQIPSGQVVARDPYTVEDSEAFTVTVPPGAYPVTITWAGWESGAGGTVTAVRILVSEEPTVTWEMALLPGQDPRMLPDGAYYGFGVDSGIGAFLDASGGESLPARLAESSGYTDPFPDAAAPACYAAWTEDPSSGTNMLIYPAGVGDGEYPVWIGRGPDGRVVSLIADMLMLNDAELVAGAVASVARYVLPAAEHMSGPADRAAEDAVTAADAGDLDNLADKIVARADDIKAHMGRPSSADGYALEAMSRHAEALRERGEHEEALVVHDRAIRMDPANAWAISLRGETYRLMERYPEALADFDHAIQLDPAYAWAIGSRAQTLVGMERYDEAVVGFNRAIELGDEEAWIFGSRGEAYQLSERYPEALADYDRAIALDPTLAWVFAYRGEVHAAMGHRDAAVADFTRAAELDPAYTPPPEPPEPPHRYG
jgi:Tfp pilus assembly protein PilF